MEVQQMIVFGLSRLQCSFKIYHARRMKVRKVNFTYKILKEKTSLTFQKFNFTVVGANNTKYTFVTLFCQNISDFPHVPVLDEAKKTNYEKIILLYF